MCWDEMTSCAAGCDEDDDDGDDDDCDDADLCSASRIHAVLKTERLSKN